VIKIAKVKNKVIHVKQNLPNNECSWYTWYEGDEVPENKKELFLSQGGILEDPVVEDKPKEVIEVLTKDAIKEWSRKEQIDYLVSKGKKPARYEKDRIKQILELQ